MNFAQKNKFGWFDILCNYSYNSKCFSNTKGKGRIFASANSGNLSVKNGKPILLQTENNSAFSACGFLQLKRRLR